MADLDAFRGVAGLEEVMQRLLDTFILGLGVTFTILPLMLAEDIAANTGLTTLAALGRVWAVIGLIYVVGFLARCVTGEGDE